MRHLLLVAVLGVGGCYPFISGGKDANIPPDQALVLGSYARTEGVGDYWSQLEVDPSSGTAWWGVFNEPHPVHTWNQYAVRIGECATEYPNPDWLGDFDNVGSGTSTLQSGNVSVDLDWDSASNTFLGEVAADQYAPNSVFALQSTDLDTGALAIEQFVRNPPAMTWTSPDLDTSTPPTLDKDQLTFTWSAPKADAIVVIVRLFDSNFQITEQAYCVVENTGSFTIPSDHWDDYGSASVGFAFIGQFLESFGPLDFADPGIGYRVTGEEWYIGAFEVP